VGIERAGVLGKHIRIKLTSLDGLPWWREFIHSVIPPIAPNTMHCGYKYKLFGPEESILYNHYHVVVKDGAVADPLTGKALFDREAIRRNLGLRGWPGSRR